MSRITRSSLKSCKEAKDDVYYPLLEEVASKSFLNEKSLKAIHKPLIDILKVVNMEYKFQMPLVYQQRIKNSLKDIISFIVNVSKDRKRPRGMDEDQNYASKRIRLQAEDELNSSDNQAENEFRDQIKVGFDSNDVKIYFGDISFCQPCPSCNQTFKSADSLEFHSPCHFEPKPGLILKCPKCNEARSSLDGLRVHLDRKHLKQPKFECLECGHQTSTIQESLGHLNQFHLENSNRFRCTLCIKGFSGFPDMESCKTHVQNDHLEALKSPIKVLTNSAENSDQEPTLPIVDTVPMKGTDVAYRCPVVTCKFNKRWVKQRPLKQHMSKKHPYIEFDLRQFERKFGNCFQEPQEVPTDEGMDRPTRGSRCRLCTVRGNSNTRYCTLCKIEVCRSHRVIVCSSCHPRMVLKKDQSGSGDQKPLTEFKTLRPSRSIKCKLCPSGNGRVNTYFCLVCRINVCSDHMKFICNDCFSVLDVQHGQMALEPNQ